MATLDPTVVGAEFGTNPLPAVRAALDAALVDMEAVEARALDLENGTFDADLAANIQTLTASGAVIPNGTDLVTKFDTTLGAQTATIGAATVSGQMKIFKLDVDGGNDVTIALTHILGLSGTIKLDDAGDCMVFISVGTKWLFLGGNHTAS